MCSVAIARGGEAYIDTQDVFNAFAASILFGLVGLGSGLIIVLISRKLPLVERRPWILSLAIILSFLLGVFFFYVSFVLIWQKEAIDFFLMLVEEVRDSIR
jgi:VIT1/CCC1 family predicted Fe2+/Mn2+ transporter